MGFTGQGLLWAHATLSGELFENITFSLEALTALWVVPRSLLLVRGNFTRYTVSYHCTVLYCSFVQESTEKGDQPHCGVEVMSSAKKHRPFGVNVSSSYTFTVLKKRNSY